MTGRHVVVAYSAMEEYELAEYAQGVEAAFPDIELAIERMSTAALYQRLLDEGTQGRWDLILGWALTTMQAPELQGLFAAVDTPAFGCLPDSARDPARRWFAPSGFVPAFCVDVDALDKRGLAAPRSWADLADSRYQGLLSIPDPTHSGAGFLHMTALLQLSGEESGWALLGKIAANRPAIVQSAFAPCLAVGSAEAAVGVTVTTAAARMVRMGLPVHMVIPADAAGYELEAFALGAQARHAPQALQVLEWMLGAPACAIYRKYHKIVLVEEAGGAPADTLAPAEKIVPVCARTAAASRNALCARWRQLFT